MLTVNLEWLLAWPLTSSCCSAIDSLETVGVLSSCCTRPCVGMFESVVFLCFISCLRHYGRSHVAMATEPHSTGNPRAHHPDPTLQAHAGLRILRHCYVWKVRRFQHQHLNVLSCLWCNRKVVLSTFIIAITEVNDLVILYFYFYSVYIRTCFPPSLAVPSDGSAFNSPQPDLLPCANGTESDRWPEGTNIERLTDTQTEESGEEEGRRTGRNEDESGFWQAAAGYHRRSQ